MFCLVFFRYAGLSLLWPLLLRSTGSGRAGSVAMAHGPSRSAACGIFPDRGTNPCPLLWQADSQPLRHQGSPSLSCLLLAYLAIAGIADAGERPQEGKSERGHWASLVAQWLRVRLPMQGTQVRAPVREDPTCHGAAGPVSHCR